MGYIKFDKNQLINLEYALNKELVRSNRAGSFSSTTILGCNTRKYHGLLIVPQPQLDGERHVLLSKVDETVIQREAAFNIGISKFPGKYLPKGHKYVRDFSADIIPVVTYRVGGVILTKETMFVSRQERVLIKYTLVDAHSPTRLKLRPFLAFRNIHRLSKRNIDLDTRYENVDNGISVRMYHGYSRLFMQLSKKGGEYVHSPDWYNDFEYHEEQVRGYEYHEDLYNPGFFEIDIKKGESIIFSVSTSEIHPGKLSALFKQELDKRTPRNSYENCLINSAEQFFYTNDTEAGIVAGYPWYEQITRFTFISLPGLMHVKDGKKRCEAVLDSLVTQMKDSLFPEIRKENQISYDSADTALWFFYAIQHCLQGKSARSIWNKYGQTMSGILQAYVNGLPNKTQMHSNGLIHIDKESPATTWMNARAGEMIINPRYGYVIEVNALWYNALKYTLELARKAGEADIVRQFTPISKQVKVAFQETFWNSDRRYLADWVYEGKQDMSVRPNQVIALSLPYTAVDQDKQKYVLDLVTKELLTPRGLRSLSPSDLKYKGHYAGDEYKRNNALHQGSAWPWLLGHFVRAYLNLYGDPGAAFIRTIYDEFQVVMKEHGIGTVSEIYDGDPPYHANGALSFAPSIAELLRISHWLNQIESSEVTSNKKTT